VVSFLRAPVLAKLSWAILIALPASAGEYAVLASGLRIHVERHELVADMVRLYSTHDSFTELRADMVAKFEEDDYVPPPVPPPAPSADANAPAIAAPAVPDTKTLIHDAAIPSIAIRDYRRIRKRRTTSTK
jgi:hypothetical protein